MAETTPNQETALTSIVPGIRRLDHVGVIVESLAASGELLHGVLGLALERGLETDHLRASFYTCGDLSIEVINIHDADMRAARLGDATARIEHLAFEVDDLDAVLSALGAFGIVPNAPPRMSGGRRTFWTDPQTSGGIMFQFLQGPEGPQAR